MYAALNSDPSDPDVIIKLDISNAFNVLCRQLTLDVLGTGIVDETRACVVETRACVVWCGKFVV